MMLTNFLGIFTARNSTPYIVSSLAVESLGRVGCYKGFLFLPIHRLGCDGSKQIQPRLDFFTIIKRWIK